MLGLRVTNEATGQTPPGLLKAFLRTLNRAVRLLFSFGASQTTGNGITGILGLIGLISLIMLFADDRHRTVMDRIAGTVITRK